MNEWVRFSCSTGRSVCLLGRDWITVSGLRGVGRGLNSSVGFLNRREIIILGLVGLSARCKGDFDRAVGLCG